MVKPDHHAPDAEWASEGSDCGMVELKGIEPSETRFASFQASEGQGFERGCGDTRANDREDHRSGNLVGIE